MLEDVEHIPRWWPSVYRGCRILAPGNGPHGLGKRVEVLTKGFLPYTLRWRYTVVEQHYPYGSRLIADGDLEGTGIWTLHQDGLLADVTYEWSVRANKRLLRWLEPLLRPLFAANHDYTMRRGFDGLCAEVTRRRARAS